MPPMSLVKRSTVNRLALGALMLLMYASVLYFAWYTEASSVLKRDQWHHLTMLTQYFDTGFDIDMLRLAHGEHMQLAYNAWFLLNGVLFGLNTQLELFLGLFFLGVAILVLFREFEKSLRDNSTPIQRQAMFLPLLMIALSFHQIISFTYSLLSFVAFAGLLLMLFFASLLNKFLTERQPAKSVIPAMMIVFLMLGAGVAGGGWAIYLGAAIVTVCIWIVMHRPPKEKVFILSAGLLVLVAVSLGINSIAVGKSLATGAGIAYVFQHADQAAQFLLILTANSMVEINWFPAMDRFVGVYVIGAAIVGTHLTAIYLFFKTRMWEKTYVPLYLIAYFWLICIALLLYRFPTFGLAGAAYPRYATSLQIGLLGVLWVIIYWVRSLPRIKANAAWLFVGLVSAIPYILHLSSAIISAPYVRRAELNGVKLVLEERFEGRSEVCPHKRLCRNGVIALKDHQLNVFRAKQPIPRP